MASKYWRCNLTDGYFNDSNNWSNSPSGITGVTIPGSSDDIFLNDSYGTASLAIEGTVTINSITKSNHSSSIAIFDTLIVNNDVSITGSGDGFYTFDNSSITIGGNYTDNNTMSLSGILVLTGTNKAFSSLLTDSIYNNLTVTGTYSFTNTGLNDGSVTSEGFHVLDTLVITGSATIDRFLDVWTLNVSGTLSLTSPGGHIDVHNNLIKTGEITAVYLALSDGVDFPANTYECSIVCFGDKILNGTYNLTDFLVNSFLETSTTIDFNGAEINTNGMAFLADRSLGAILDITLNGAIINCTSLIIAEGNDFPPGTTFNDGLIWHRTNGSRININNSVDGFLTNNFIDQYTDPIFVTDSIGLNSGGWFESINISNSDIIIYNNLFTLNDLSIENTDIQISEDVIDEININVGGNFEINGSAGDEALITSDDIWYLNVSGNGNATYTNVEKSDASGGSTIDSPWYLGNTNNGNNTNWDFHTPYILISQPESPIHTVGGVPLTAVMRNFNINNTLYIYIKEESDSEYRLVTQFTSLLRNWSLTVKLKCLPQGHGFSWYARVLSDTPEFTDVISETNRFTTILPQHAAAGLFKCITDCGQVYGVTSRVVKENNSLFGDISKLSAITVCEVKDRMNLDIPGIEQKNKFKEEGISY